MKITKRAALYFFVFFLILPAGDFSLWGEEDGLEKYGVIVFDERHDAPEFSLSDLTGSKRNQGEFQGKFIMLNFWATW